MLKLPSMAQIKLDRIATHATEAMDAANAVALRASDLSRALSTAPASEAEAIKEEIGRLQQRLTDQQERHRHLANLTANLRHFVSAAPQDVYEMAKHSGVAAAGATKTQRTTEQAVAALRARIKTLAAERVRVMQCGIPTADLKELASAFVQSKHQQGAPKLTFGHDRPFAAIFNALVDGALTTQQDIAAALAWLDPDRLEKRLHDAIDKLPQPALAMSSKARVAKLAEIEAALLDAERDEEALIELSEERGQAIHRRLDADPRAVLGIAMAKAKRPKLERVKAA